MTPTDPIRDEAVKVLAEAIRDIDLTGISNAELEAAAILDASPTLARRLALGTAVDTAPEELRDKLENASRYVREVRAEVGPVSGYWYDVLGFALGNIDTTLAALAAKLGSGK